jgi:hypothetical protein
MVEEVYVLPPPQGGASGRTFAGSGTQLFAVFPEQHQCRVFWNLPHLLLWSLVSGVLPSIVILKPEPAGRQENLESFKGILPTVDIPPRRAPGFSQRAPCREKVLGQGGTGWWRSLLTMVLRSRGGDATGCNRALTERGGKPFASSLPYRVKRIIERLAIAQSSSSRCARQPRPMPL